MAFMELPPFPLLMFLLLTSSSYCRLTPNNNTDLSALLSFKSYVTDPTAILASRWTTNTSFCSWFGISCSRRRQRVTSIDLHDVPLHGTISRHIANLSFLSYFYVGNCSLSGSIPGGIPYLPRLAVLILEYNSLSGYIPSAIFNMSSLESLYLGKNNLTGSIPVVVLPRLQHISLGTNHLTGEIPSSFARCKELQSLSLAGNMLTGTIPSELGSCPSLTTLFLGGNQLTGKIPSSTGNLSSLRRLDLSWNMLEGTIPGEWGSLSKLSYLHIERNNLTGSIPISLLNASSVDFLNIGYNKFTGTVPLRFGESMPLLTVFNVGSNQLTGGLEFLRSLSNCRELELISVSGNEFEGVLPGSVWNLSQQLQDFYAGMNHIRGEIPKGFRNLSSLVLLDLDGNELTGGIPSSLASLMSLQVLHLGKNQLREHIPAEIGLMTRLVELDLHENALSGPIPDSMSNVSTLQHLSLSSNRLVASIPNDFWNLRGLIGLNLSYNSLDSSLPVQIRNLKALDSLDLSMNSFSGNIPSALGDLQMLTYLDLSNNSFDGQIPQSLGLLISVVYMNLSRNFLSGTIPESLANLQHLNTLDLSRNQLEGPIPKGRVFSNTSIPSLMGNGALCGGAPKLDFSPCLLDRVDASRSRRNLHILKYVLPTIASTIILLLASFCLLLNLRRRKAESPANEVSLVDFRRISYHDLVKATENFSDANLLGKGSVGTVFKALLDDGLIVAVKVLNLAVQGASRSFDAECQALSMVRHRNLVRIISTCSNDDFKALILQFMPNGSLEKWLHSDNCYLNILQRINIVVDVSLAVEYLHHHHHSSVVVHRDLKPSNVLLDENMVAHVGDFGIAKLLQDESRSAMSATTRGTIGYMAPEYGSAGKVSREGDVYSFGILLLETFTRKRPTDAMFDGELNIREWVSTTYPVELLQIIDCNILREEQPAAPPILHKCLSSMIELGLLCSRVSPSERPQMKDVLPKLQKIKMEYLSTFHSS